MQLSYKKRAGQSFCRPIVPPYFIEDYRISYHKSVLCSKEIDRNLVLDVLAGKLIFLFTLFHTPSTFLPFPPFEGGWYIIKDKPAFWWPNTYVTGLNSIE